MTRPPGAAGLPSRAAVLGLGLIGGSVARELAAAGVQVCGYDRDPGQLRAALDAGCVEVALTERLEGLEACDLVVLAVPVDVAPALLARVAPLLGAEAVITDTGSTKQPIVDEARRLGLGARFVGSHPLAGDHRSGWGASRAGLFEDARVFLCAADGDGDAGDASDSRDVRDVRDVRDAGAAIQRVSAMWRAFGAHPELTDAARHDRQLAWSSHLPHFLAGSLALALSGAGIGRGQLGPGGRDMTRLAGSSPALWAAVARQNADAIADALAAAESELAAFREALRGGDSATLQARLATSRAWFEAGP
ncbi:MAG TPA: prephenate dehydrogenase [Gemmatimonadaceae bacterium]